MYCIFPACTCTKQQKRDKRSRGLEGNTLSNVLCWEGGDGGLTIQRKRVNGPLLRERETEWLFMATDLPGENVFPPKISYLPFLYSVSGLSMVYLRHTINHTHTYTSASNCKSVSEDDNLVLSLFPVFSSISLLSSNRLIICFIFLYLYFCSIMT